MNENKGKILSFTLLKVEKGREKICKCDPPHYQLDTVNRIVTCSDCGATLDPFEALISLSEHMQKYYDYQKEALKKIKAYREMANKELRRRIKNRAFKEMDSNYKVGLYPICPNCQEMINPMKITQYLNERYQCDENV